MLKSAYGSLKRNWMFVWSWSGGGLVAKSCLILATPWTVAKSLLCPWDFPGKNTGLSCHLLLQGIFPTQELNPRSPALEADSLLTELPGLEMPFSKYWLMMKGKIVILWQRDLADTTLTKWITSNKIYYQHTIPADIMHWEGTSPLCFTSPIPHILSVNINWGRSWLTTLCILIFSPSNLILTTCLLMV